VCRCVSCSCTDQNVHNTNGKMCCGPEYVYLGLLAHALMFIILMRICAVVACSCSEKTVDTM
jgi:hypothetical protein